jgi:hypothetical protein
MTGGIEYCKLQYNGQTAAAFIGPALGANSQISLALTRPITFNSITPTATGEAESCLVGWIGNQ